MAEKKEKRYVSDNAQLMAEWNWEKNNELGFYPKVLTLGSNKKVWWKCSKGHEWLAVIANRNKGFSCPYCSGRYIIKGENQPLQVAKHEVEALSERELDVLIQVVKGLSNKEWGKTCPTPLQRGKVNGKANCQTDEKS